MKVFNRQRSERPEPEDVGTMSLMEHLRELRGRVFKCAAAVIVAAIGVYILYDHVYAIGVAPYCEAIKGTTQGSCKLLFIGLTDVFMTKVRISTYVGLVFAMPVVFWQLWRFIAPGLYSKEKRYAIGFVATSVTLFTMGAVLAYFSLPPMFRWLIDQGSDALIQPKAEEYFSLITTMLVAFGFCFEFPIFLLAIQLIGVVSPDKLAEYRRHAIVAIFFIVAIVTPGGDPVSLFALSIPLCLFYEASIWAARAVLRRRNS